MNQTEIIFLLGMPGCGKSVGGKILAEKLNFLFIDLDLFIQKKEEKNIREIFRQHGEEYFREKESAYLKSLPVEQSTVVSLGGGTPCFHDNMNWIKENGKSFYLKMNSETLAIRIQPKNQDRPLLNDVLKENLVKKIEEVSMQRESFYGRADFIIECGNESPEMIAEKVFQLR
jgi:shikimate kinase